MTIWNTREYIENFLMIRTKDGRLAPLRFNPCQERFYEEIAKQWRAGRPVRVIVLKARQEGMSTITEAIMYKLAATHRNTNELIMAHTDEAATTLFRMNRTFYDNSPALVRPMQRASSAKEIVFDNPEKDPEQRTLHPGLGSRIRCHTAGGSGVGRSETFQLVHCSELAFWRGDAGETLSGVMQAVPALPGTMVVYESTAFGFNLFKDLWDAAVAGESDFVPLFFAWYDDPEYQKTVPEGTAFTDEENEIARRFGLSPEQLYWRRWCIRNNCHGDLRKFRQEYPSTPDEAFLTTGDGWFDNETVMVQRQKKIQPLRVGEFLYDYDGISITNIRWADRPGGCVRIYEKPEAGRPYVVGGDTAGEGSDWFTGFAIDNITSRQCAVLHQQFGEAEYARQMYCLGMHYNEALLGVENNYSTFPTMELARLCYPKLYVRERPDTYTGKTMEAYGFVTGGKTRPVILAYLQELQKTDPELFEDDELLGEMLTFVRDENQRPAALVGKHDDFVMGLAITYGIRDQQRYSVTAQAVDMSDWPEDIREDYERAGPAEQARLRKVMGNGKK